MAADPGHWDERRGCWVEESDGLRFWSIIGLVCLLALAFFAGAGLLR